MEHGYAVLMHALRTTNKLMHPTGVPTFKKNVTIIQVFARLKGLHQSLLYHSQAFIEYIDLVTHNLTLGN